MSSEMDAGAFAAGPPWPSHVGERKGRAPCGATLASTFPRKACAGRPLWGGVRLTTRSA